MSNNTTPIIPTVGMGVTFCGWSDCEPYEIVRVVSDKCLEIRKMDAVGGLKKDAQVSVGGFCAHVHDQHDAQEWVITSNPNNPVTRIRLGKIGWKNKLGKFTVGKAYKFYDYNF